MKKLLVVLLLVISIVLTGCSNSELINEKYLIVSTSPDYAPYEFVDPSKTGMDKYVGADIELMKYIASEMNLELKIEEMDFDACLTAIQGNKVDIGISGFSWTPKRAENYELSNSYFDEGDGYQQILILAKNAEKFKIISDLNKAEITVAAQSGSIQDELVDTQIPLANKQNLDNLDMAVSLLIEEKVDAVAISSNAADIRIINNDALAIVPENFDVPTIGNVVVAKKGNTVLMEKINTIIEEVVANSLYNQWMEEAKLYAKGIGEEINE